MKTLINKCIVRLATPNDIEFINDISKEMAFSATQRGTGIALRTPEYLMGKINKDLAMIAIHPENGQWIGFCYLEFWQNEKYVANSGLIISPKYRGQGYTRDIKTAIFSYCKEKFPAATLFSLTSNAIVMKLNREFGYKEVPFSEIVNDVSFISGCDSWVDYVGLMTHIALSSKYIAMVHLPVDKLKENTFRSLLVAS